MDAAGSLAGPGKRQRRGPPGLTLLARSREMGELKAGGLVFAAWVERHNTLAPEVVYCCSTQLGAVAKASVQAVLRQLASEHLLDSHCRGLTLSHISVVELSRYELAGGGAKPPPEELPPEAPADPRRSFKYRLKRLVDAAEQCSDGPFVAYVLSTGHKTAVKQLAGGDLARAVYCSELWAAVFEVEMGIAPTPWQDDAVRADLPPGTLGWYAAFMAFGQGAYLLHPTAGSWLLPDAMADAAAGADSGALVWRIKDAPVHVQVEERPLQPARVTCDCSSFRAVGAAVGRCLHTVYISSLEPPPPGPPPPVLIPAARCPRVDDVSVQPGDYIWLPDRTFVACVARSGQLRCCHSGCRGACQHVLEVQAAFGPHLPTPAASHSRSQQSGQQTGSEAASAGLAAAAAGGGGAAGAASASIRDGARRAVVVEEEEEPAGDALPLPPAVRYPYPCDATTAVTMAGWEKAVLLSSPGLGGGGGAAASGSGAGGAGGGSGSGGSSGQQGCALSSGALLDLVPLLPAGGGQCACGSTYALRRVCPAIVYGPQHLGPIDAQLHELRSGCGKASCVLAYDGVHDGLFRYSSRSFFSLRHMYTYADQLIGSGMNVEAYAKSQQRLVATTLPPDAQRPQQFTAGLFRRSWQQFEAQLDRCHTFSCPICRRNPHVLVGDATAITMSVDLYMGTPVTDRVVLPPSDMGKRAHKRADRCWCPEEKGRAALRGYSSALRGDGKDVYGQKVAGWAGVGDSAKQHDSPAAVGAMEASLPAADQSSGLTAGFLRVASNATSGVGGAPGSPARLALARLVDCMGSTAPAIAYLPIRHVMAVDLCAGSLEAQHAPAIAAVALSSLVAVTADEAPVLSQALGVLARYAERAPAGSLLPVAAFLRKLRKLAVLCGEGYDGGRYFSAAQRGAASAETSECLRTAHCCGVGIARPRYATEMDAASKGGGDEGAAGGGSSCSHNFCARGPRTGGIFTLFCEHGVCYAFFVLPGAEGRDEMYSWMVSYLEEAPKVVVYDFACSLHEYCLNRSPGFFKDTLFLVDRFHWKNHTGCSHAYNLSLYQDLQGLNSEVAEQVNSLLQPYKPMVSQMRQDNFMSCLRFVLGDRNSRRISFLEAQVEHASRVGVGG